MGVVLGVGSGWVGVGGSVGAVGGVGGVVVVVVAVGSTGSVAGVGGSETGGCLGSCRRAGKVEKGRSRRVWGATMDDLAWRHRPGRMEPGPWRWASLRKRWCCILGAMAACSSTWEDDVDVQIKN